MNTLHRPRLYSDVNLSKSPGDVDYSNIPVEWGKQEHYEILKKVSRGKYSDVYEGLNITNQQKIIIKILKPIRKSKVLREIKILKTLQHVPGIPHLIDVVKDNPTKTPSLILQHFESSDISSIAPKLEVLDLKFYLYETLRILDQAHSNGIIHRDLKPSNIIVNHSKRTVNVINWGLAEFYFPEKPLNTRVATRYYKSPDLLMSYEKYDYSVDMWSFGTVLASLIFRKNPFFHGHDNYDQLVKIVKVLGTAPFLEYLEKYNISFDERSEDLRKNYNTKSWQKFANNDCKFLSDLAIDLLSKVLVFDHGLRILPAEAMQHEYFEEVREMLSKVKLSEKQVPGEDTFSILVREKLGN